MAVGLFIQFKAAALAGMLIVACPRRNAANAKRETLVSSSTARLRHVTSPCFLSPPGSISSDINRPTPFAPESRMNNARRALYVKQP